VATRGGRGGRERGIEVEDGAEARQRRKED
jgi:hypothetical protein